MGRIRIAVPVALLALLVAVLVLAGCGSATSPSSSGTGGSATPAGGTSAGTASTSAQVVMKSFAFSPAQVEVSAGGTVVFKNDDSVAHTVTGEGWDSGTVEPGASFSKTFDKAGTYAYACTIHPSMTGTVVVK